MGISFDRIDDRIQISDNSTLKPSSQVTISFWVKIDNIDTTDQLIITKDSEVSSANRQFTFGLEDSGVNWNFRYWDSSNALHTLTGLSTPSTDINYHIIGLHNGSTQKFYIDGSLISSSSWSNLKQGNVDMYVGGRFNTNPIPFSGTVSELYMWNVGLNEADIYNLYNSKISGVGLSIKPSNLVLYLPMNNVANGESGDAVTFKDLSGTGNDGTGNDGSNNTGLLGVASEILSYSDFARAIGVLSATNVEQEGFRWRDDDNNEASATWLESQDTDITRAKNTNTRLRVLVNED